MSEQQSWSVDLKPETHWPLRHQVKGPDGVPMGSSVKIVTDAVTGEQKYQKVPPVALDDTGKQLPNAHLVNEEVINQHGNRVSIRMTSGVSDIPPGTKFARHIPHEGKAHMRCKQRNFGHLHTDVCFDTLVMWEMVLLRTIVDRSIFRMDPCGPDCTRGGELCPKTARERDARLARTKARNDAHEAEHHRREDESALRVSHKANQDAASTLGPAIAAGVAEAIKAVIAQQQTSAQAPEPIAREPKTRKAK